MCTHQRKGSGFIRALDDFFILKDCQDEFSTRLFIGFAMLCRLATNMLPTVFANKADTKHPHEKENS